MLTLSETHSAWAWLRILALFVLHLGLAAFGTAVLESILRTTVNPLLGQIRSPQSAVFVRLGEEWALSLGCAASIGLVIGKYWPDEKSTRWIWIVPATLLLARILLFAFTSHERSVLDRGVDTIWSRFSGLGCYSGNGWLPCVDFFLFTLAAVRSSSYSAAAWFAARQARAGRIHSLS